MAFNGFSVWSLVTQSLCNNFFRTVLLWLFNDWRPSLTFSIKSLQGMFTFGSKLLFAGMIATLFDHIYLIVIGKFFSVADLGFYSRSKKIQNLQVTNITSAIGRVTFSVFSSIKGDKARLKRGVRKALTTIAMFNFPMMVGLAVVARPLVQVLLTDKWLPCVPYLQLLCVVGMLYPLQAINLNVLKAQGRSDLFFRLEILKKVLVVIAIAVTYRWGIIVMIYGQIVTSCLAYFLNTYYTGKMLDYPITEQFKDLIPILALVGIMSIALYPLKHISFPNQLTLLSVQISTGIFIYIGSCYVFRVSSFLAIITIVKTKMRNFKYAN